MRICVVLCFVIVAVNADYAQQQQQQQNNVYATSGTQTQTNNGGYQAPAPTNTGGYGSGQTGSSNGGSNGGGYGSGQSGSSNTGGYGTGQSGSSNGGGYGSGSNGGQTDDQLVSLYHGEFMGSCGNDGFYYVDENKFVVCSNGYAHEQPCSPGTMNSPFQTFDAGAAYSYRDFCDVNLVDNGYSAQIINDARMQAEQKNKFQPAAVPRPVYFHIPYYHGPVYVLDGNNYNPQQQQNKQ